jgi:hypothetical protein
MSKKKSIIIASGVFLLLIIALIVLLLIPKKDTENTSSSSSQNEIIIFEKKKDEVKNISIKKETETFEIIKQTSTSWIVDGYQEFKQNAYYIKAATEYSGKLISNKLIEQNPKDLSMFGLDKPQSIVLITYIDNSTFEFHIGKSAPADVGYYMLDVKNKKVYIISTSNADPFLVEKVKYISNEITSAGTESEPQIALGIDVKRPNLPEVLSLVAIPDSSKSSPGDNSQIQFLITSPVKAEVDYDKIGKYLNPLVGFMAKSVVSVNPTSEALQNQYGFLEPTLQVSTVINSEQISFVFGKYDKEEDAYYMISDTQNILYLVSSENIPWMQMDVKSVMSKYIMITYITELSGIEFTANSKQYKVELTGKDKEMKSSINGKSIDIEKFKKFYANVISITADDISKAPPKSEEIATITYIYADKTRTPAKITFYKEVDRRCAVAINGEMVFLTKSTNIDKFLADIILISENKEVKGY